MGPTPTEGHGVAYAATQMLRGLAAAGVELDCFVAASPEDVPMSLRSESRMRFHCEPVRWEWERWYSRDPLSAFVTGQTARMRAQGRLARVLERLHATRPYDLVYQYSQIELGALRGLRARLPPVVLHPEVHAAGELRWLRLEAALMRRCASFPRRTAVRAMLALRSFLQRRDMPVARLVIAPSRHFAEQLGRDYGVAPERLAVVPNPIDLRRFSPADQAPSRRPLTALFVSRIAVRKGVETVVQLSHRLADLAADLHLLVVGDKDQWSDYRPLLRDLHPGVASYHGPATAEVPRLYREAAMLLQIPHYEPFGLTVGEALASGCPVISSDVVGAVEDVDRRCCRIFPTGDLDALEGEVRRLLAELQAGGTEVRRLARAEAERLFDPLAVGERLAAALETAVR